MRTYLDCFPCFFERPLEVSQWQPKTTQSVFGYLIFRGHVKSSFKIFSSEMEDPDRNLGNFLSSRGFKSTREREIILKDLEARREHFNAEDLYAYLSRKGPRVSKPTIYRTLKLLEKLHLIKRFDIKKNCFYYEPVYHKDDHAHLICEKCGKIIDFSIGDLGTLRSAILKKRNFTPDYISIRIFGLCKRCQEA